MKGRLLYVAGPSGAGKDSVIDYARTHLPPGANVVFARRTITRPSGPGEDHVPVSEPAFETLLAAGAFAMHWRANGIAYGIGREVPGWLDAGRTVVVSGSRAHLPEANAAFPGLEVVLVTASPETLARRLAKRGREDAASIRARLARAGEVKLPDWVKATEIRNDGDISIAGGQLLALLG